MRLNLILTDIESKELLVLKVNIYHNCHTNTFKKKVNIYRHRGGFLIVLYLVTIFISSLNKLRDDLFISVDEKSWRGNYILDNR